jgi:hypothetical protein
MAATTPEPSPLWRRLAWFVGIAVASSAVTILIAYGLRALLRIP